MGETLVVHHDLRGPGGAELVVAATCNALHRMRKDVLLSSVFKFEKNNFGRWFGIDINYVRSSYYLPFDINSFAIYARLLVHNTMKKALVNNAGFDLIWVDMPTYGKLKQAIFENTQKFVEYIHFPLDVMLHDELMKEGLLFGEEKYVDERYGNPLMRAYYNNYLRIFKKYCRMNPFDYTETVIANSSWTADVCEKMYGKKPKVINPPISSNVIIKQSPPSFDDREDRFVLLGRFTNEKKYHWALEEVLPLVKKENKEAEMVIIGSANNDRAVNYVAYLRVLAEKKGYKVAMDMTSNADVRLITNATRTVIGNIMDTSKVFMHATVNEHWGISVAEAMATGLPVVIHMSGGAWSDISMEGRIGYGYKDPRSASHAILNLMVDKNKWLEESAKSIIRAKSLTVDDFIIKFIDIVSQ